MAENLDKNKKNRGRRFKLINQLKLTLGAVFYRTHAIFVNYLCERSYYFKS